MHNNSLSKGVGRGGTYVRWNPKENSALLHTAKGYVEIWLQHHMACNRGIVNFLQRGEQRQTAKSNALQLRLKLTSRTNT